MNYKSIAIDGPSGAGKSTLAKLLASELGYLYVDTGAIYRTVGLCAFRRGIAPEDLAGVVAMLGTFSLDLKHGEDGLQHMYLDGEDVSADIRCPEISMYASAVSALPEVREFLMEMQRGLARRQNVIMDGRDIGTVVLPDADLKLFLTASAEDRAQRRYAELREKGIATDFETVLADMATRDKNDASRAAAPLRQAEDAVLVDTSELDFEQSFAALRKLVEQAAAKEG